MKITVVCHGNIARSQVLHHYLAGYANRASLSLDLFSCGTATQETYPDADRLLAEVRTELERRGVKTQVQRNIIDNEATQQLIDSDVILAADQNRQRELQVLLGNQVAPEKIMLFYEFIGEGSHDFVDTYDAKKGAQDPERFAKCFNELERIARLAVEQIQSS